MSISWGCMNIWLVFLTLILLTWFSHWGSLVSGGGQWANHVPRVCSRLIGISRRSGWASHLSGRWPDGGSWSSGGKWTQQRACSHTWSDLCKKLQGSTLDIMLDSRIVDMYARKHPQNMWFMNPLSDYFSFIRQSRWCHISTLLSECLLTVQFMSEQLIYDRYAIWLIIFNVCFSVNWMFIMR